MRVKRIIGMVLAFVVVVSCLGVGTVQAQDTDMLWLRATGRFSMDIPGDTSVQASTSFPLEAGETVTIKASYSPFAASVDFGLIAPDGLFYFVNVTNGSIDQTIEVDQRGNYTFAVRNNSSNAISVSGYVNY